MNSRSFVVAAIAGCLSLFLSGLASGQPTPGDVAGDGNGHPTSAPDYEDVRYGKYERNVFDLWMADSTAPTPLIVFIHGGGFTGGNKNKVRGTGMVGKVLSRGISFASIQYRFRHVQPDGPTDPQRAGIQDILRDSARAIQFMRVHAGEYNVDPDRLACYGGSAGAGTSLWLAFHDDLAVPGDPDVVLRQSSRVSVAGMLNGQFSYDLSKWDSAFSDIGGQLVKTHGRGGRLPLHEFFGLTSEEYSSQRGAAIRADVDMRGLISRDDPPVFLLCSTPARPPTTRGVYNHHPRHAELIEKRCRELGVEALCLLTKARKRDAAALTNNPDAMLDFFCQHLSVEQVDESGGKQGTDNGNAQRGKRESVDDDTVDSGCGPQDGAQESSGGGSSDEGTAVGVAVDPLPVAEPVECGLDPVKLNKVVPALQHFVDQGKIPGAVVAVARNGKLIMLQTVGYRNVADQKPMQEDTIFRIYSMSKPITSVAAMMLVERGKIKLEDPVSKYIPAFADSKVFLRMEGEEVVTEPLRRAITIRDLMRHTSGLTYGFFGNSKVDQLYREANVLSDEDDSSQLADKVARIPLMYQPGDSFQYGVSVDVLGRVVEVVSGMSLDDYFSENLFKPLGMRDTGFFVPEESMVRFATNYSSDGSGHLQVADAPASSRFSSRPKMLSGGGGLVSTIGDYLQFSQMMMNGGEFSGTRILTPESVAQMTRNQLPSKAIPIGVGGSKMPGVGFGLGFSVVVREQRRASVPLLGEYGWDGMASTHYWSSPASGLSVVVLTQVMPFSPQLEMAVRPLVYDAVVK